MGNKQPRHVLFKNRKLGLLEPSLEPSLASCCRHRLNALLLEPLLPSSLTLLTH
jgi:hypothetical protein